MFVMKLNNGEKYPENANKVEIENGLITVYDTIDSSKE